MGKRNFFQIVALSIEFSQSSERDNTHLLNEDFDISTKLLNYWRDI